MPVTGKLNEQEHPVQDVPTIAPAQKRSRRGRSWFLFFLLGALIVVALYLVIPLMIFLGIARDLLTQLLSALLLLAIAEFVIVSILLKTASSMKPISGKMRAAQVRSQENDNLPFDALANAETVGIPAQRHKKPTRTRSRQPTKRGQDMGVQLPAPQPLRKAPSRPLDEE